MESSPFVETPEDIRPDPHDIDPRSVLYELKLSEHTEAAFTDELEVRTYQRVIIDLGAELVRRLNRSPPFPNDADVAAIVLAIARSTFISPPAWGSPRTRDHPLEMAQTLVLLLEPSELWDPVRRVVTETVRYMAFSVESLQTLGIDEAIAPGWPPYCIVVDLGEHPLSGKPEKLCFFFQRRNADEPRATMHCLVDPNRGRNLAERMMPYLVMPHLPVEFGFCAFVDARGLDWIQLDRLISVLLINSFGRAEQDPCQAMMDVTLRLGDAFYVHLQPLAAGIMRLCAKTNPVPRTPTTLTSSRELRISSAPPSPSLTMSSSSPTDKQIDERGRRLILTFALLTLLSHRVAAHQCWMTPRTTPAIAFKHLLDTQPASLIFSLSVYREAPSDFNGALETIAAWARRAYLAYAKPPAAAIETRVIAASKDPDAYIGIWDGWRYRTHINFDEHEIQSGAALTDLRRLFMGWLNPSHYNAHYHNAQIDAQLRAVRDRRKEELTKNYTQRRSSQDLHLVDLAGLHLSSNGDST